MTSGRRAAAEGPWDGPLGRAAERLSWYGILGLLTALGTVPSLVLILLLDRSAGNALLVPLCLLPAAPSLSAGFFALHQRQGAADVGAARAYGRGLRLNARDVLVLWAPALAVLGVVSTSVVHRGVVGIGGAYVVVLGVVGVGVALWALEALALVSVLSFRLRDVARLSTYFLARRPGVTLGLLALLVVAVGTVWFAGELAAAALVLVWLGFLHRVVRPVLGDTIEQFTN